MDIVVYKLYGHYSFNARDGGERVKLALADGYTVSILLNGARMILGPSAFLSVEQAIYHGLARVVA
jgi:hypothetical protein